MYKFLLKIIFFVFFLSASIALGSHTSVLAQEFNIATFNVFSKAPNSTGMTKTRLNSIQSLINNENLDFIGLQEVDNNHTTRRNIGMNILGELANPKLPYQIYGQTLEIFGGQYGNGMLTKNNVKGELVSYLPNNSTAEQRSYQRVILEKNGYFIAVYNTHLSHEDSTLRKSQINRLISLMNSDPIPNKVLMGDFNVSSTSELNVFQNNGYNIVKDQNNDFIKTFPTTSNNKRAIDFIIVSNNISVLNVAVKGTSQHSDHHMLRTKIKLNERGDENLRFEKNGQLMFTIGKDGYLIRAEEYTEKYFRIKAYQYYPNTRYGSHGNQIKYIFNIGRYGNVEEAFRRKQGTKTLDRRYTYYPNAKYGIHGSKIKSSAPY